MTHPTRQDAVNSAQSLAEQIGRPVGVWIVGPQIYATKPYTPGDDAHQGFLLRVPAEEIEA